MIFKSYRKVTQKQIKYNESNESAILNAQSKP